MKKNKKFDQWLNFSGELNKDETIDLCKKEDREDVCFNSSSMLTLFSCYGSPWDGMSGNIWTTDEVKIELDDTDSIKVLEFLISLHPENERLRELLDFGKATIASYED